MTDREPHAPADPPRPRTPPPSGGSNTYALSESAPRGDGPLMPVTFATPPPRTDPADPVRTRLAALVAAEPPAFAPAALPPSEHRTPAEADAAAAAEARLAALDRLAELAPRLAALDAEIADLAAGRERIEQQVRDEAADRAATAFTTLMDRRKAEHDAAARVPLQRRIEAQTAQTEKETSLATLRRQHAAATRKPGFFARLFG